MPRSKHGNFGGVGSCLGTIVVAMILGSVAYTEWQQKAPSSTAVITPVTSTDKQPAEVSSIERAVLSFGVSVPDAKSDRLFELQFPDGKPKEITVDKDWRIADMEERALHVESSPKNDGSFVLSGEDEWNVPLRTRGGKAYHNVTFLGLFDAAHAALTASADGQVLLSVSKMGEVRELLLIGGERSILRLTQGAAWLSTFQPGEGIESPPSGPSALMRIEFDGTSSTIATAQLVITTVTPGHSNALAYSLETGEVQVHSGTEHWKGQGRPLVWLDDKRLVLARGVTVYILDLKKGSLDKAADLPAAPSLAIFSTDRTQP